MRMDDGEAILEEGHGRIKMDKYEQQLQSVSLFISPHEIIHSNLSHFMDIMKDLSTEQQNCCRYICNMGSLFTLLFIMCYST